MILFYFYRRLKAFGSALLAKLTRGWRIYEATLNDVSMLLGLWRRRRAVMHAINREYYPTHWRPQAAVARYDVGTYLMNEGKGKENPLELLKLFYQGYKDIQDRLKIYGSISVAALVYMASYVHKIKLSVPISGITLEHDPTVLAVLFVISSYFGYRAVFALSHAMKLRGAMIGMIEASFDPQLGESLISAFMNHDTDPTYTSRSNPQLILRWPFYDILRLSGILALLAMAVMIGIMYYIYGGAIYALYYTPNSNYPLHLLLMGIAIGFGVSSLCTLIIGIAPLRYRDWTTNSKFEILAQLNPKAHDEFRSEIYAKHSRLSIAMEKVWTRLKLRLRGPASGSQA